MLRRWIVLVLILLAVPGFGLNIESDMPGNIFRVKQPISVRINQAEGTAEWVLKDLFGKELKRGTVSQPDVINLGIYPRGYYELTCSDSKQTVTTAIGVVSGYVPSQESKARIGIDTAIAWCISEEQWKDAAEIVKIAGMRWVRERIAWGGVESWEGNYNWEHYDKAADILHAAGINISQVMDYAPHYSFEETAGPYPADMTAVYRFTKAASERYKGKIQAWEMWNEVDNGWPALGDTYSAALKAAYLGVKDTDPQISVLCSSFSAHSLLAFADNMGECGVQDYTDMLNLHRYHEPSGHESTIKAYKKAVRTGSKPVWLTETNLLLWPSQGADRTLLGHDEQLRSCRYIPRAAATLLSSGLERIFFFMLPHRPEGDVQFGLLRPDLTPYPAYIALANAAEILGDAKALGRIKLPKGAHAYLFETPKGRVIAAWADSKIKVTLPLSGIRAEKIDMLGGVETVNIINNKLTIDLTQDAIYLRNNKPANIAEIIPPMVYKEPCRIVFAPKFKLPVQKPRNWYKVSDQPVNISVEAFNLDPKSGCSGKVSVAASEGWKCSPASVDVSLEAMGRKKLDFTLTPGSQGMGPFKVKFAGDFGKAGKTHMVSYFGRDIPDAGPAKVVELDKLVSSWQTSIQGAAAKVAIEPQGPNDFRIRPVGNESGNIRIVFEAKLTKPVNLKNADIVSLTVKTDPPQDKISTRLYLTDWRGAGWEFWESVSGDKDLRAYLLKDINWQWWTTPYITPGLEKIESVKVGVEFSAPFNSFKLSIDDLKSAIYP